MNKNFFKHCKSGTKMWAIIVFKKTAYSKKSPDGRKFAQSGRPASMSQDEQKKEREKEKMNERN
jgi:hypothetical protein